MRAIPPPLHLRQSERQALTAFGFVERTQVAHGTTLESLDQRFLEKVVMDLFGPSRKPGLGDTLESLASQGFLRKGQQGYRLSEVGSVHSDQLYFQHIASRFDRFFHQCETSGAYRELCERVHGTDLCQFNIMSAMQTDLMISVLDLDSSKTVLDFGCGTGMYSELIASLTGAHVTGIDIAARTVRRAIRRCQDRRSDVEFIPGELNTCDITSRYDSVIAVDSLYLLGNLQSTIHRMTAALKPGGGMAIFHNENTRDDLRPRLASVLWKSSLEFRQWDLTEESNRILLAKRKALSDLEATFKAEGNRELHHTLVVDVKKNIMLARSGANQRFFYHAVVPPEC